MKIDIHAHCLPQQTLDELRNRSRSFPSVAVEVADEQFRLSFAGRAATRPVAPKLRDVFSQESREAWLEARAIDLQLTGGWLDSFGYELPADEGADWSRYLNEFMRTAYADRPMITALATVPLQSGKLAAQVLREAHAEGMRGAMIGTQAFGDSGNIDSHDLDEFWDTAQALRMPIIVHPMFGSADARLQDFEMMNAVGRVNDVTIAISRLLFAGTLIRFPELIVIASTGGGALPYALGRLERNYLAHPKQVADPIAGFEKLYFDSLVFQSDVLDYLVGKVGAERIMLGSDYPFPIGDPDPCKLIEQGPFDAQQKHAMFEGVARRLFNIE